MLSWPPCELNSAIASVGASAPPRLWPATTSVAALLAAEARYPAIVSPVSPSVMASRLLTPSWAPLEMCGCSPSGLRLVSDGNASAHLTVLATALSSLATS